MILCTQIKSLTNILNHTRKRIHFVPTMGALHKGHLSLIASATRPDALVVCSIFVNPTQFNQSYDLSSYPRIIDKDMYLLKDAGCQVVFIPSSDEVYPKHVEVEIPDIEETYLLKTLEGYFRPGHFEGMLQVVNRLIQIVKPQSIYMGQKDWQQQLLVSKLLKKYYKQVSIEVVPTVREEDGLAMSSRNMRLSPEERSKAAHIYKALRMTAEQWKIKRIEELETRAFHFLESEGFTVEYFKICERNTLNPITEISKGEQAIILTACWLNKVRLIDNFLLNK